MSKKREKVALAQLKVNQLMKRHEMKRRMEELRYQEELMEAQMEEEQAIVSYNIYNDHAYVDRRVIMAINPLWITGKCCRSDQA